MVTLQQQQQQIKLLDLKTANWAAIKLSMTSIDQFSLAEIDHCIFFLYHFHTFLYTPLTLNPKP